MHRHLLALCLLLLLLIQGCAAGARHTMAGNRSPGTHRTEATVASTKEEAIQMYSDNAPAPSDAPKLAENAPTTPEPSRPDVAPTPAPTATAARPPAQRSPILIYTATFQMAVFEVEQSLREVDRITQEVGGFATKRTDRQITIRVPASRFYETVGRLEKLGDVTHRDVVAQDVTEEYLDTEVRLRNARAMRDRLEQLLAKATTVQDSLLIERELNRVAAEIERMEGRLKFLRDRAALSTITVSFEPRRTVTPPPSVRLPFPWLTHPSLSRLLSL